MRKLLWLFLLLIAKPAFATNAVYVGPSPAGSASGLDCGNAYSFSYFNTAGNWSTTPTGTQIGPGTTVHLCGGTYSFAGGTSCGLSFQGSGSSANAITLIADQGAVTITAPYWAGSANGGGICSSGYSYLTIDGNNSLTIQATANGTSLANKADYGFGVWAQRGDYVTIKNLTVSNIYVHSCTGAVSTCTDENGQNTGGISAQGSNVTVSGNTVHDAKWCLTGGVATGASIANRVIANNTIYNCDHGIAVGVGGDNGVLRGLAVYNNDISNFRNWDDAANNNHHDGIHIWSYNSGDLITGAAIYNNYIHGDWGANMNAALYAEARTGMPSAYYFNNVIVDESTVSHQGCGMICLVVNGVSVFNNTLVAANVQYSSTGLDFYGTGVASQNNILQGMFMAVQIQSGASFTTIDHNDYYNIGGNGWNFSSTLSNWQSGSSADLHSVSASPNLTATFTLQSGSAAIGLGANLYGVCNGQPNPGLGALCYDKTGKTRPSSGAWDAGAYNYGSGSNSTTTVQPPTGLSAFVQ